MISIYQDKLLLMSNMVTRCPKCATSFRITSAQLQSAKGAVRCGSCLHIFKAQEHLAGGEPSTVGAAAQPGIPSKTSAPVAAKATAPTAAKSTNRPADLAARKVGNPNTGEANRGQSTSPAKAAPENRPRAAAQASAVPSKAAPTKAAPTKTAAPPPRPTDTKPTTTSATGVKSAQSAAAKNTIQVAPKSKEQKLAFDQELINRELLSSDDDFLISDDMDEAPRKKENGFEFDGFIEIEKLPAQNISLFDREVRKEEPEETDNTDESWAMDLLDDADDDVKFSSVKDSIEKRDKNESEDEFESYSNNLQHDEEESAPKKTHFSGHVFSLVGERSDSNDLSSQEIHPQPYTENTLYQQTMSDAKQDSHMRAHDTSRAALLMNIMPEPVVMTSRRKNNWSRKKLWVGLSLLMVVVLLAQTAWLQFDNLNRIEPYRNAYEIICPIVGCKLPALVDRSKIRTNNLVVRNHPKTKNALMIDAIILNNAAFQQPFPDLVLEFSTIDDTPVAARRFTPEEYLGGELAGQHLMPQNQPVHLTLELVDPGPEAVNYRAYIPE